MNSLQTNLKTFLSIRAQTANIFAKVLKKGHGLSEKDCSEQILKQYKQELETYPAGWYDPPAGGAFALFGSQPDFQRLRGGSMRLPESWPRSDIILNTESVGMVYASPVDKGSGVIGDLAATVYNGKNPEIQQHLVESLRLFEQIAEISEVGMRFSEIYERAQELMQKSQYAILPWPHVRSVTKVSLDLNANIGHTIPWTHELPNPREASIIEKADLPILKDVISKKRIFASKTEKFKIPRSIVFGVDFRIVHNDRADLPPVYFYPAVIFDDGQKSIISNLQPIFDAAGMDYIKSKY